MADLVVLNIGGVVYETSRMTLLGGGGASFFSGLLGDTGASMRGGGAGSAPPPSGTYYVPRRKRARHGGAGAAAGDSDGDEGGGAGGGAGSASAPLFIDRSGALFAPILEYLRTGSLPAALQDDRATLADLSKEASYYLIDPLIAHITERQRSLGTPLADFWGVKLPSAQGQAGGSAVVVDVPEGREITITRVVRQPNGSTVGKGFRQFVYLSTEGVDRVCIAALSGSGPGGGADEASAAVAAAAGAGGVQQVNVDIRLRRSFTLINETRGVVMHVIGYVGPPTLPNAPQAPRGSLLF
jgi:hypothetical protein